MNIRWAAFWRQQSIQKLLLIALLAVGVFAATSIAMPDQASAAATPAQIKDKAQAYCSTVTTESTICTDAYEAMFKAHSANDFNNLCGGIPRGVPLKYPTNFARQGACTMGRDQGTKDGETDRKNSQPAGSTEKIPTDKELTEMAKKDSVCKALGGDKMKESCYAGFIAGYKFEAKKSSKDMGDFCKNGSTVAAGFKVSDVDKCRQGFEAGREGKKGGAITPVDQVDQEPTATNNAAEENDDCDTKFYNPLTWIVCPLIDGVNTAVDQLDVAINNLLTIDTARIFDSSDVNGTGYAYQQAWNSFRVIGIAIIVISALIVIVSSAFGFEILDAYTIRKTLPRLLIALLVITLSWDILYFLVSLSNDVGNGVRWIIYEPFSNMEDLELGFGAMSLSTLMLSGGVFALGILGSLSFAVTALLAALIAFLVLILRELIIIFLVILAPVAIACMILPNTRKAWDFWQKALISMLMAFPIIAGMIAIGRVFSTTVYADGNASSLEEIIAYVAYLLPYFLLPFAFRMAGGLMATLGGISNDRSRGAFDRLKNFRQGRVQKIHEKRMTGNSWVGTGRTGGLYRRAAAGGEHGSWSPTARSRARWQEETQKRFADQNEKVLKEQGDRAFANDDASQFLRQRGLSRRQFVDQYAAHHMQQNGGDLADAEAAAEAALTRAEQATGYRVGSDQMASAALKYRIAHTNTAYGSGADAMMEMRAEAREAIDDGLITIDDATAWMKQNQGRGDFSTNSYGATRAFLGADINDRDSAHAQIDGAFQGADPRAILGSHQNGVVSYATAAQRRLTFALDELRQAQQTGDTRAIANAQDNADYALADVANIHNALSSVSPNKANEFANNVLSQPSGQTGRVQVMGPNGQPLLDNNNNPVTTTESLTFRQLIDEARNDSRGHSAFHDRSREYASARQANAAGAAMPPQE